MGQSVILPRCYWPVLHLLHPPLSPSIGNHHQRLPLRLVDASPRPDRTEQRSPRRLTRAKAFSLHVYCDHTHRRENKFPPWRSCGRARAHERCHTLISPPPRMSAAPGNNKANGADKEPKDESSSTDYTIAKAAGAVIATGIAWSVFKTFWPKKSEEVYETASDEVSVAEGEAQEKIEGLVEKASSITKKFPKFSRKSKHAHHEVSTGDTLYAISRKYGVSIDSIKAANNLPDDLIVVGEKLNIPS